MRDKSAEPIWRIIKKPWRATYWHKQWCERELWAKLIPPAVQNNNRRLLNVGSMSGALGLRWYSHCDGLGGMIPWFGDVESDEEMRRYDHAAQAEKYADENRYHKTNVDIALIPFWANLCEVSPELLFLSKRLMHVMVVATAGYIDHE